jgi:phosphonate transport system permease protein
MAALSNSITSAPNSLTQAFTGSSWNRALAAAVLTYVLYAFASMGISWDRFLIGLGHGANFIARMFPPDLSKMDILAKGLLESMQIAVLASALGVLVSLPIGLFAARNLMPLPVTLAARGLIAVCRSLHPVIMAILFVKAVGFGALAGILALIVATIGFVGKLFADAIEEISLKQVEAIRATGASFLNVILFGVLPQVLSRFVGFATYQLDSNLRNSTMVGIVGAGGIGGALFAAFQRFEFDFVFTILFSIVSIIVIGELVTNLLKRGFKL